MPAREISPILTSKANMNRATTTVVILPCRTIMIARVAISPTCSIVLVVTDVICPRLVSLKYPIGRYRRCSPISIRFNAHVSYPASVWSMDEKRFTIIFPKVLISINPITVSITFVSMLLSSTAFIAKNAAGIFMAVNIASSTPSTAEQ